jgi:hypothetical protein
MNFKIGDRVVFKLDAWREIFDILKNRGRATNFSRNNPAIIEITYLDSDGSGRGRTDDLAFYFCSQDDLLKAP